MFENSFEHNHKIIRSFQENLFLGLMFLSVSAFADVCPTAVQVEGNWILAAKSLVISATRIVDAAGKTTDDLNVKFCKADKFVADAICELVVAERTYTCDDTTFAPLEVFNWERHEGLAIDANGFNRFNASQQEIWTRLQK